MTRQEFESKPSAVQRKIAEREYLKLRTAMIVQLYDEGIYSDAWGPLTEAHHIWPRSHCPLWMVFQRENIRIVSRDLHFALHNIAPSCMNNEIKTVYLELESIKNELIRHEQKTYQLCTKKI